MAFRTDCASGLELIAIIATGRQIGRQTHRQTDRVAPLHFANHAVFPVHEPIFWVYRRGGVDLHVGDLRDGETDGWRETGWRDIG